MPAHQTVGSQWGPQASGMIEIWCWTKNMQIYILDRLTLFIYTGATINFFTIWERYNMYVPEMPGAVTNNDISLSPVVPSQSQIGQGQSPLTCLAYNKGDNQISQTSGTSLTESGKPTS